MRVRHAKPLDPAKTGSPAAVALDRERVRRGGLAAFVRRAWHVVESGPYLHNWHVDLLCAHLEAVTRGEISDLLINVPPGCMKSLLVSVFWPVWEWIHYPETRALFASFDASLARRDANKAKELVSSDWFRARWGDCVSLASEATRADSATEYYTQARGLRFSTSVAGRGTGWHGHRRVVDDPIKPRDARGGAEATGVKLAEVVEWWGATMGSRRASGRAFASIAVMQRLHEADLSGHLLSEGKYVHVCLPMEFDPERRCETRWGRDPRTTEGELLWPARFPADAVASLRDPLTGLGPVDYEAQYQQRPMPRGGGMFSRKKVGRYLEAPNALTLVQSWDMRFKDDATRGDFVVGGVWAKVDARFYLLKVVRGRWSFSETLEQVLLLSSEYPRATAKLVENKANGPAIVNALRESVHGLILVEPEGGKVARANAVSALFDAGNVYVPDDSLGAPWVADYLAELEAFPRGRFDDQVDMTSQALSYLKQHATARFVDAMRALRTGR